jgi:hypothetical protein
VGVVEWFAWAAIGQADPQTASVPVRRPVVPGSAGPDASANGLTLSGLPTAARAGEQLAGMVTVQQPEHVKANKVEVRLIRRCAFVAQPIAGYDGSRPLAEQASESGTSCIIHDDWVTTTEAFGKHTFEQDAAEQGRFEIAIPADAGPTVFTEQAEVSWRVEAALHRMLHDDLTVAAPLEMF